MLESASIARTVQTARFGLRPALAGLVRLGYAARGVLYLIIGWLAGLAALGLGGRTTDTTGALHTLLGSPFGRLATAIVVAGLLSFALWRLLQASFDMDGHGLGVQGLLIRGGMLISAVGHTSVAFVGLRIFVRSFALGGSGDGKQKMLQWLMELPAGRYWIGLLALLALVAGAAHFAKGVNLRYQAYLQVSDRGLRILSPICSFGLAARGVVFLLIGFLLGVAAVEVSPNQPVGLGHALDWLERQPYGSAILAVVGLGLLAFGLYSLIEAVWRRIDLPTQRT